MYILYLSSDIRILGIGGINRPTSNNTERMGKFD